MQHRAQRQLGAAQFGHRRQRRRQGAGVDRRQRRRRLVEPPEQQQAPGCDQPCLHRVALVGMRLQRGRRRRQRARRAGEVAHRQRDLGLRDDAARLRQLLVRAERARRAPEQLARLGVVAQLRHRDAAQGQRRRVVAQRDAPQRPERVAGSQGAGGGGDERIHGRRLTGRPPCARNRGLSSRFAVGGRRRPARESDMHDPCSFQRPSIGVRRLRRCLAGVALAIELPAHAATIACPPVVIETPVVNSLLKGWEVDVRPGRRTLAGASIEVSRGSDRRGVAPDATGHTGRLQIAAWTIAPGDGEIYWVACSYGNTSALLLQRVPESARRCVASYDVAGGRPLNVRAMACE